MQKKLERTENGSKEKMENRLSPLAKIIDIQYNEDEDKTFIKKQHENKTHLNYNNALMLSANLHQQPKISGLKMHQANGAVHGDSVQCSGDCNRDMSI